VISWWVVTLKVMRARLSDGRSASLCSCSVGLIWITLDGFGEASPVDFRLRTQKPNARMGLS
jgi:hypothetical protein